jgi:hypothetical protein
MYKYNVIYNYINVFRIIIDTDIFNNNNNNNKVERK